LGSDACGVGAFGDTDTDASPDTTPAPPTGLAVETNGNNARLTWEGNAACDSGVGRYRVRFKTSSAPKWSLLDSLDAEGRGSQQYTVAASNPLLGNLPTPPDVPTGLTASSLDSSLLLTWTPVTSADGYRVTWGAAADSLGSTELTTDPSTHILRGLSNGKTYFAAVASYENRTHLYAVTALPITAPSEEADGESQLSSSKEGATGKSFSSPSPAVSGSPDSISGTPLLESKGGCFVQELGEARGNHPLAALTFLFALGLLYVRRKGALWVGLLVAAFLLAPSAAQAEGPRWSVTAAGGVFFPAEKNWSDSYDSNHLWDVKLGAGVRLFRQLEFGVDGGYRKATGKISKTDNGTPLTPSLTQTLTVAPVQAYALLNLCFTDNQWVVPYVAGGYSRYYFRHEIEHGETTKGHQDGYHARGGLKILLDVVDDYFADRASQHWGIRNTYLTLEAQYAKVDDRGSSDTDLGGMSYSLGLAVEF